MASLLKLYQEAFRDLPDPNEPQPVANRKATIFGSTITFLVLSWLTLLMRLYTRFRILKKPGWDDVFVTLAAILNSVSTIFVCISVRFGLGTHFLSLEFPVASRWLFCFYMGNACYVTTTAIIKISLLLQYLRVFKRGTMKWICISLLVLISIWGLVSSFMAWVPCMPVAGYWNRFLRPRCYAYGFQDQSSFVKVFEIHTALNMTFDAVVLIIPMMLYFETTLNRNQILALTGLFTFGGITFFTSAWRLYTIVITEAATYPYLDFTWWGSLSIILSCLEIDLAIMCASMPIFWPVLAKSLGRIFVTHEVRISVHSRGDSESDKMEILKHSRSESLNSENSQSRMSHYQDQYVIQHVNPFRETPQFNGPFHTDVSHEGKGNNGTNGL